jgi:hypothetical protein
MAEMGHERQGGGKLQVQQCPQCPVSDGRPEKGGLSLRAKSGRERCSKCRYTTLIYSITSLARTSSDGEMVRPSAFAVLRLMMRSNLVGCSTGRSAGFAPRKILST